MEEEKKKKRGWVKDAAIIFLAVLLVLTFFSNTILNRSLPEVATVYVQEGTITNKVRGTGTVTARENYDVTIDQTRKVQSVLVRLGDEVKVGDVLFTLQPGDSDELENAEKQLKKLEEDYQLWLLDLAVTDYFEYDRSIADAREALVEARSARDEAAITDEILQEFDDRKAALDDKIAAKDDKIAELDNDILDLDKEIAALDVDYEDLEKDIAELEIQITQLDGKLAEMDLEQAAIEAEIELQKERVAADTQSVSDVDVTYGTLRELELQMRELKDRQHETELVIRDKEQVLADATEKLEKLKAEKQKDVDAAKKALDEVNDEINDQFGAGAHQDADYQPVSAAKEAYEAAQVETSRAEKELQVAKVVYKDDYEKLVKEATFMEYNDKVYAILDDTETRYRTRYRIARNAELTEEEEAEIYDQAQPALRRLGDKESYVATQLNVYLPAAAEKYAGTPMGVAYEKIKAAEKNVEQKEEQEEAAEEAYDKAYDEYKEKRRDDEDFANMDRKRIRCQKALERAEAAMEEALAPLESAKDLAEQELNEAKRQKTEADNAISDLQYEIDRVRNEDLADRNSDLNISQKKLEELKSSLDQAKADQDKVKTEQDKMRSEQDKMRSEQEQLRLDQDKKRSEQEQIRNEQEQIRTEQERIESDKDQVDAELKKLEDEYKQAQQNVKSKERALEDELRRLDQQKKSDGKQQVRDNITQRDKLRDIEEQRALVEELSNADNGTEVRANVAGTIQSLSVSAGHKAEAGAVLATIEVPDLGYGLSFTVTTEQARRLKVGDSATVSNYYWGSQIVATLTSIQTDPQNPQGSRILNFDVTGDVTAGNSLTIAVGEKNANYDMVVPNSAVRSDTNGSFVLMITAKNSPLGNRYFATRVNVEVVASDEQYSAISGALEAYDSVITTASRNAPISSGDQVRLADSNS